MLPPPEDESDAICRWSTCSLLVSSSYCFDVGGLVESLATIGVSGICGVKPACPEQYGSVGVSAVRGAELGLKRSLAGKTAGVMYGDTAVSTACADESLFS